MRNIGARTGVLALVLVLCLAALSAGYAKWSDTLYIDGTVDTGWLAVQFSDCKSNDPYAGANDPREIGTWTFDDIHDPGTWAWTGAIYDRDEAYTDATIGSDGGPANSLLMIDHTGGYPGYCAGVAFSIDNIGTVPAKVESIKLTQVSKGDLKPTVDLDLTPGATWYFFVDGTDGQAYYSDSLQYDLEGNVISEFSLTLSHLAVGAPVDPDGAIPGDICWRVEQGAQSSTTYDFLIEIVASQYNEV